MKIKNQNVKNYKNNRTDKLNDTLCNGINIKRERGTGH